MFKELRGQIEDGEQQRKSLSHPQERRVKQAVVLPDPRSHLWKLELHHASLFGAEITEKLLLLLLETPSKNRMK